ncbi:hypothetical protein [Marinobacter panjinensis]|uniref:hypothetical protein n=1 Tax=Marinobacter panjinensis TaxID=2576384 RepID=UPI001484D25C|nr:hypothetical protein [Marinobacter panjinensis]MCR8913264.1 hypothetical protein [Marinobacter panjinensis]
MTFLIDRVVTVFVEEQASGDVNNEFAQMACEPPGTQNGYQQHEWYEIPEV